MSCRRLSIVNLYWAIGRRRWREVARGGRENATFFAAAAHSPVHQLVSKGRVDGLAAAAVDNVGVKRVGQVPKSYAHVCVCGDDGVDAAGAADGVQARHARRGRPHVQVHATRDG